MGVSPPYNGGETPVKVNRPKLLDLFSGAGGCARGYADAGFEITLGVDAAPMPRYPYPFLQADVFEWFPTADLTGIAAIHASPVCKDHSRLRPHVGREHGTGWQLAAVREQLQSTGLPWVIENVPGAPMRADYKLCGCMFGLPGLRRERWFETSWQGYQMRQPCHHVGPTVTVAGHPGGKSTRDGQNGFADTATWKTAMGIDWMTARELAQAIPPLFTQYIGEQLLEHLAVSA